MTWNRSKYHWHSVFQKWTWCWMYYCSTLQIRRWMLEQTRWICEVVDFAWITNEINFCNVWKYACIQRTGQCLPFLQLILFRMEHLLCPSLHALSSLSILYGSAQLQIVTPLPKRWTSRARASSVALSRSIQALYTKERNVVDHSRCCGNKQSKCSSKYSLQRKIQESNSACCRRWKESTHQVFRIWLRSM